MKTIREIALYKRYILRNSNAHEDETIEFAESVLAEYLAQQEPVAWMYESDGVVHDDLYPPLVLFNRLPECARIEPSNETPLFIAPPVPAGMQLVQQLYKYWMEDANHAELIDFRNQVEAMFVAAKESNHAE